MNQLWLATLPLIETRGFVGPVTPRGHMAHEVVFDVLHWLNFRDFSEHGMNSHRCTLEAMRPAVHAHAVAALRLLADFIEPDNTLKQ